VTELQQNRYDQLLRRVGDLKGPGSKVNDVLQELFPMLDVENVPGELLLLMGTQPGWAGTAKTPTAGKKTTIQLFNPLGSGQLITISTCVIGAATTGSVRYGLSTIALGTNTGIARARDGRVGIGPTGIAELRTTADGVALSQGEIRLLGNTSFTLSDANSVCILSPGVGMNVTGTVDQNMTVSFFYRERVAEPSELAF